MTQMKLLGNSLTMVPFHIAGKLNKSEVKKLSGDHDFFASTTILQNFFDALQYTYQLQ
jgi:hypothetical protein